MGELLQDELVPLQVAAALAYFDLNRVKGEAGSDQHLRDVVELAAIALSYVARTGKEAPNLDRYYIRRSDLHAAIRNLRKQA